MYQEYYQSDQFQIQEAHSKSIKPVQLLKSTAEQELEAFISKESILPRVLNKQKSVTQFLSLNQRNKVKKKISLSKNQTIDPVPKKSSSQYSIIKRKSRANRYQPLDVNKSKTFEKAQRSSQSIKHDKRQRQAENVKIKNQISINKKIISLRNANQINQKLTLSKMHQNQVHKIQQYFGHSRTQLQKLSEDQLNRLNNRLHDWIEKFNKKLDGLLENKISQETKNKSNENNSEKIKQILEKHISINNDLLRRMLEQNKKIQSKGGEMKQEQYEFLLDKESERLAIRIKEETKRIIQCKKINQLSAAKILNQTDSKAPQLKVSHLKAQLLQLRRDELSNELLLQKLDLKFTEVRTAFEKSEDALQRLFDQAGDKQTQLSLASLNVKYEQMKKKHQKIKITNTYAASTTLKYLSKIVQQNKLLKNEIKQYSSEIEEVTNRITSVVQKSNSLIQQKKDIIGKSKLSNSNSIQFFIRNSKQSLVKITPFDITRGIEPKTKTIDKKQNQEQSTKKQQKSDNSTKNQALTFNIIKQEEHENQFLENNQNKKQDYVFQEQEKAITLTPKRGSPFTKQVQKTTKTISVQQQPKKNPRHFMAKKRDDQEHQMKKQIQNQLLQHSEFD